MDNGSGDDSATRLRSALPAARVLESGKNLGFSGGCNVGIRDALTRGAERVLLVNSDVVVAPDALQQMEDVLLTDPRIGIVGPVLLSRAQPELVSSMGIRFDALTGRMRHRGVGARLGADVYAAAPRIVDAVSGCVMLIRREVLERVGLLDERYFYSFEDIDFCLRARRAGWRSAIAPAALAYHEGSVSIGSGSPRKLYFASRNHLLVAKRAAPLPIPGLGTIRTVSIVGLNALFALVSSETSRATGLKSVGLGAWHHVRRRYGNGP